MKYTSFSWEIRSEFCAVKTVDATLIKEGTTGIPQDIVPFFFGKQLEEGEVKLLSFSILGKNAECLCIRKNNRHRFFLKELKNQLIAYKLVEGDLLFFDKNPYKKDSFLVSAILNKHRKIITPDIPHKDIIGEDRLAYMSYRVGHEFFSEQVRLRFGNRCAATGVDDLSPRTLIASHIKPWRLSKDHEKVDCYNGLLLAPNIDKLFDLGHLSFTNKGEPLVSSSVNNEVTNSWELATCQLNEVTGETLNYLAFHRELHNLN